MEQVGEMFKKIEEALTHYPKKVLIVEENPKHATALSYFLSNFNITSEIKSNVKDSVEALTSDAVNCVILDMGIPDKTGYETLEAIKKNEGLEIYLSLFSQEKYKDESNLCNSGKEAIQQLKNNPDISMSSWILMMPEMDGYETIRRIRQSPQYAKLPIMAVTAKAMTGDREKCIIAGASDYISKPVDTDQLLSLLRLNTIHTMNNKDRTAFLYDDINILEVCSIILTEAGYNVEISQTSHDIIEKAAEVNPDVILMDNWIPDIGGIKATQLLKAHPDFNPRLLFMFLQIMIFMCSQRRLVRGLSGKTFDLLTRKHNCGTGVDRSGRIKNIILDYGNVIFMIDFMRAQEAFTALGIKNVDQFFAHKGHAPLFDAFEKGEITAEAFRQGIRDTADVPHLSDEQIDAAWNALLIGVPQGNHELLLELKGKYRLFLLSNNNEIHYQWIMDYLNGNIISK
ncbi:hypothetical protein FQR65_LT17035 [Abscondita terminalis]|nr:hypothetical protein FQR65_LT17035 [Abscondita terminalis]